MTSMQVLLIVIVIFLVMGLGIFLAKTSNQNKRQRRLSVIAGQEIKSRKQPVNEKNKRRADLAKKLKESEQADKKTKKSVIVQRLQHAGFDFRDVPKFWMLSFLSFLLGTGTFYALGVSKLVLFFIVIIFFFGLPRFVLKVLVNRRQKKFLMDFADALESMMRLLKAGMPVGEAIAMVSREFTGPVGEEMSQIYEEQKVGIPMAEAVQKAAERMPLTEMQMFATGIAIQQQTGSSLSEILQNLASVIRSRFRLKRKVAALSSEAKASASIIGALPVVVATGLYFINTEYMLLLFTTTTGKAWLTGAILWMCAGILVMRKMINFKV